MGVEDMVGQMFVLSVGGTEPDYHIKKMVREWNIGGMNVFSYIMNSEEQTESLVTKLQKLSMQTDPAVPLFVVVDQEGGDIASAPWVAPEPTAAAVGRHGNPDEVHRGQDGTPAPAGRHQHGLRPGRRHLLRGRDR
jgi:beta-N-acetylhexosaminidase